MQLQSSSMLMNDNERQSWVTRFLLYPAVVMLARKSSVHYEEFPLSNQGDANSEQENESEKN